MTPFFGGGTVLVAESLKGSPFERGVVARIPRESRSRAVRREIEKKRALVPRSYRVLHTRRPSIENESCQQTRPILPFLFFFFYFTRTKNG